jgi:hypothetical protein
MKMLIRRAVFASCLILVVYANVWQRVQVLRVGYDISRKEEVRERLTGEHRFLWLALCRVRSVERVRNFSREELNLVDLAEVEIVEVVNRRCVIK